VAEALKTDVVDQGSDGLTINRVRDAHKPGAVAAMGKALLPVVS